LRDCLTGLVIHEKTTQKTKRSRAEPLGELPKNNDSRHAIGKMPLATNFTFDRNSTRNWNTEAFIALLPMTWGSRVEVCMI
jgi:hypothetical protein